MEKAPVAEVAAKGHPRSSAMTPLGRSHVTSCRRFIVGYTHREPNHVPARNMGVVVQDKVARFYGS